MMQGRIASPTTEEKRSQADQKERAERYGRMSKIFTSAGSATRPTLANMVIVFTHYGEWDGILGKNPTEGVVFVKKPPFADDYEMRGHRTYPTEVTPNDLLRVVIWFERNASMVIDNPKALKFLRFAMRVAADHAAP